MAMKDQAKLHGYSMLEYKVGTADGNKLGVHRISGAKGTEMTDGLRSAGKKEPVLLTHGVTGSRQTLVSAGTGTEDADGVVVGKAYPYQLVDTGKYDVWLMNARGNYYSRDHLWLNPDTQEEFWDFSVTELAEYDLKAVVEFI